MANKQKTSALIRRKYQRLFSVRAKSVIPFVIRLIRFSFVLFVLLILGLGGSASAQSRVFYENFEDGNADEFSNLSPNINVTTLNSRGSGSLYSLINDVSNTDGRVGHIGWRDNYEREFFIRLYVRINNDSCEGPWGGGGAKIIRILDEQGSPWSYESVSSGQDAGSYGHTEHHMIFNELGNIVNRWGSVVLNCEQWHKFEYYHKDDTDGTDGIIKLWWDDVLIEGGGLPYSGDTINNADNDSRPNLIALPSNCGSQPPAPNHIQYDDVEIYTDSDIGELATGSMADGTITVEKSISRVFYENFDDGNADEFDIHNGDVVTTQPHLGEYCGRGNWGTTPSGFIKNSWPYTGETFIRYWIRIDPNCEQGEAAKFMRIAFGGDNSDTLSELNTGTGSVHQPWYVNGICVMDVYGGTLGLSNWTKYEVYIKHDTNDSDGIFRVWINDILIPKYDGWTGNTFDGGEYWYPLHLPSNWVSRGPEPNYIYFDDVEIYSDQGTGATGSMADGDITISTEQAPSISSVNQSSISHGDSVTINGSWFGEKVESAPYFYDSVDNQEAYNSLNDNDVVPIGGSDPWPGGNGNLLYSTSRTQRNAHSLAMYTSGTDVSAHFEDIETNSPYFYISWWFKANQDWQDPSHSNKIIRLNSANWPGRYMVSWCESQFYVYDFSDTSYICNDWGDWYGTDNDWNRLEIHIDSSNGNLFTYTNLFQSHLCTGLNLATYIDYIDLIGINKNGDEPGLVVDFDEIYVDTTQARVEIGDNSSWDNCTHREIQIPTAWSDDSTTITANQGSFQCGDTAYLFVVDENGDVSEGYPITFGSGGDITPPSRSNPQPTGTLTSGTTSTTISLNTNETAICKYSANAGTNYDLMENTFTSTNSTSHSQTITGLSDGETKTYYIRCQDESGNQNTDDFEISFSIASPSATYSISNFINLVTDWLKTESGLESDVNGDGVVNTRDLGIMMSNWSE